MTFGTHSNYRRNTNGFKAGLFISNLLVNFKIDSQLLSRLVRTYQLQNDHWKFINTSRPLSRFEHFEKASENVVLFQTRCFLHENDIDLKQIHKQRYHIIKLLRKNFPDEFLGGFVPSKLSKNVPSK